MKGSPGSSPSVTSCVRRARTAALRRSPSSDPAFFRCIGRRHPRNVRATRWRFFRLSPSPLEARPLSAFDGLGGTPRAPGARSTDRPCCARARALLTADVHPVACTSVLSLECFFNDRGSQGVGNTEGTPARARVAARGHSCSADFPGSQDFLGRCDPRLPALPASSLHGKEGVDGSSPSEGSAKSQQIGRFAQDPLPS
jgi:hypothetical protein